MVLVERARDLVITSALAYHLGLISTLSYSALGYVNQSSRINPSSINASPSQVYRSKVDSNTDLNMVDVMGSWTLQMNFPVLSVERYDAKTLAVSQRRFLISGPDTTEDKPSPYG